MLTEPVNQLHYLSSPKAWSIKTNLWKFQTAHGLLLYFRFVCLFLILMCSTVGQILTDCGQCIEVWCVPSATCGLWVYQSQYRLLNIGQFVGLHFNFSCYAPCGCSVYRSNPTTVSASMIAFIFVRVEWTFKYFNPHIRTIFSIRGRLWLLI